MSQSLSIPPAPDTAWNYGLKFLRDAAGNILIRRNDPCPCGSGKKVKNCCRDLPGIYARCLLKKAPAEEMRKARVEGLVILANENCSPCQLWCYMRTGQMLDESRQHNFSPIMLRQWGYASREFQETGLKTVDETLALANEILLGDW